MAKVINADSCALDAAKEFCILNKEVKLLVEGTSYELVSLVDPEEAGYTTPEGWYVAKGALRNKHRTSTGSYDEIYFVNAAGEYWKFL